MFSYDYMEKKTLKAKLKDEICVVAQVETDFNKNWIESARIIEEIKAKTFLEIKQKMHEKIATMTLEDVKFEIRN